MTSSAPVLAPTTLTAVIVISASVHKAYRSTTSASRVVLAVGCTVTASATLLYTAYHTGFTTNLRVNTFSKEVQGHAEVIFIRGVDTYCLFGALEFWILYLV